MKELSADENQGMPYVIRFRNFCLPACYLRI